jgi:hypothetical protein
MFGIHFGAHGDAVAKVEEIAEESGEELMPQSPPQPKRSSPRRVLSRQRSRKPTPSQKHKYDEARDDGGSIMDGHRDREHQGDDKGRSSPRKRHSLRETTPSPRKSSSNSRILSPRQREDREERERPSSPRKRSQKRDTARSRISNASESWSSSSFSSSDDSRGTRDTFSDGSQSYSRSEGTYSDDATFTDGTFTDEGTKSNDSSSLEEPRRRTYKKRSDTDDSDSSRLVASSYSSESTGSSETGTDDSYAMYEARTSPRDYTSRFAASPKKETRHNKLNSKHDEDLDHEVRNESRISTDSKKGKKQRSGRRTQKEESLSVVTIPPSPREVLLSSPRRRQRKDAHHARHKNTSITRNEETLLQASCQTPRIGNGNSHSRASVALEEVDTGNGSSRGSVDDGHLGKYSLNKKNSRKVDPNSAMESTPNSADQSSEDTSKNIGPVSSSSNPKDVLVLVTEKTVKPSPRFTRRPSVLSSASQETVEIVEGASTDEEPDYIRQEHQHQHQHQAPRIFEEGDDGVEIVKADSLEEMSVQSETEATTLPSEERKHSKKATAPAASKMVNEGAWDMLLSTVKTIPRYGGSDEEIRSVHSRVTVAEAPAAAAAPPASKYDSAASVTSSGDSISLAEPTNNNIWSQSSAMYLLPPARPTPAPAQPQQDESLRYVSLDRIAPPLPPPPPPPSPPTVPQSVQDESKRYVKVDKKATTPRRRRLQKQSQVINPQAPRPQQEDESLGYITMDKTSMVSQVINPQAPRPQQEDESLGYITMDKTSMVPSQRQHQMHLSPTFPAPRAQDKSDTPFSTAFEDHVSSLGGGERSSASPGAITTPTDGGKLGPMFPMMSDPAVADTDLSGANTDVEPKPTFRAISSSCDMDDLITQERLEYRSIVNSDDDTSNETMDESDSINQDAVISTEDTKGKQKDSEAADTSQKKSCPQQTRENKPAAMDALAQNMHHILKLDSSEDPWDVALAPTHTHDDDDDDDVETTTDAVSIPPPREEDTVTPEDIPLSPSSDSLRSFEARLSIQTSHFEEDSVRSDSRVRTDAEEPTTDAEWITFSSELDFSPKVADATVSSGHHHTFGTKKAPVFKDLVDQPSRSNSADILSKKATTAAKVAPTPDWEASFLADEALVAMAPRPPPSPRKKFVEALSRQRVETRRSSNGSDMKFLEIVTATDPSSTTTSSLSTIAHTFSPRHASAAATNINSPRKRAARLPQSSPLLDDHYSLDAAVKPRNSSRPAPLALSSSIDDHAHHDDGPAMVLTRPAAFSPRHHRAPIESPRRGKVPPGGTLSPRRRIRRLKIPTPTSSSTTEAQPQPQPYSELHDAIGALD